MKHPLSYHDTQQTALENKDYSERAVPSLNGNKMDGLMGKKIRVGQKIMVQVLSIDETAQLRRNHRIAVEGLLKKIDRLKAKIALLENNTEHVSTDNKTDVPFMDFNNLNTPTLTQSSRFGLPKIMVKKRFLSARHRAKDQETTV